MGAIVSILLALFVLAALVFVFITTSGTFREQTGVFTGSNVDSVVGACNRHIDLNQGFEYCCVEKSVNTGDEKLEMTCDSAREQSWGVDIEEISCEGVC